MVSMLRRVLGKQGDTCFMDPRPGRFYALPAQERDKLIVQLRQRGWTYKRIGKHPQVGMSESGVKRSIDRILAGGFGQGISRM